MLLLVMANIGVKVAGAEIGVAGVGAEVGAPRRRNGGGGFKVAREVAFVRGFEGIGHCVWFRIRGRRGRKMVFVVVVAMVVRSR